MINFDKASIAPIKPEVKEAVLEAMDEGYGNPSSLHSIGIKAKNKLEECREIIASTINADPSEIIFTSGATEAINWFGKLFIAHISEIEHHAVNHYRTVMSEPLHLLKKTYQIDLKRFKEQTFPNATYMVSYVNNEIGVINPIEEMCKIKYFNAVLFVDGTQAYGHIPIDVKKDGMEYMCTSAQKFGGIAGTGFLYKKNDERLKPVHISYGGQQELGFRAGTENLIGIIAMTKAAEIAHQNMREKRRKVSEIRNHLYGEITNKISCARLNGSADWRYRYEGNLNFRFDGYRGEEIQSFLNDFDILVSTGSACASGSGEPSHVLKAIGLTDDEANSSIRFSFDSDNHIKEVGTVVQVLMTALEALKR